MRQPLSKLDVALLQHVREYPCISLLAPVTTETATMAVLHDQLDQVRQRLEAEFGADDPATRALLRRVGGRVAAIELDLGATAVAVFVSPSAERVVPLNVAVEPRVIIDDTFATRDLVKELVRTPHHYVLSVTGDAAHLHRGTPHQLQELRGGGFPVRAEEEPVGAGAQRRQVRDPSKERDRRQARLLVEVDEALAPHLREDPLPLVVVASSRRLAWLAERSRHRAAITATVAWGGRQPTGEQLRHLIAPAVETMLAERQAAALAELDQSMGAHRYSAGVDEIWHLANEGRGDLLVVEEGFAYPARVEPGTNQLVAAVDPTAPDVVDDAVDDIIELVLAARGRALVVPDGTLTDRGRIALTLRH